MVLIESTYYYCCRGFSFCRVEEEEEDGEDEEDEDEISGELFICKRHTTKVKSEARVTHY